MSGGTSGKPGNLDQNTLWELLDQMGDMAEELRTMKQSYSPRSHSSAGSSQKYQHRELSPSSSWSSRQPPAGERTRSSNSPPTSRKLERSFSERNPDRNWETSGTPSAVSPPRARPYSSSPLTRSYTASQLSSHTPKYERTETRSSPHRAFLTRSIYQATCTIRERSSLQGESPNRIQQKESPKQRENLINRIHSLEARLNKSLEDNYHMKEELTELLVRKKRRIKDALEQIRFAHIRFEEFIRHDFKKFSGKTIHAIAQLAHYSGAKKRSPPEPQVKEKNQEASPTSSSKKVKFFGERLNSVDSASSQDEVLREDDLIPFEYSSFNGGQPKSLDDSTEHRLSVIMEDTENEDSYWQKILRGREEEWRKAWQEREKQIEERERSWNDNHAQWESIHRYWKQQEQMWRQQHDELSKYIVDLRNQLDKRSNHGRSPRSRDGGSHNNGSPMTPRRSKDTNAVLRYDSSVRNYVKEIIDSFFAVLQRIPRNEADALQLKETQERVQSELLEQCLAAENMGSIEALLKSWSKFKATLDDCLRLLSQTLSQPLPAHNSASLRPPAYANNSNAHQGYVTPQKKAPSTSPSHRSRERTQNYPEKSSPMPAPAYGSSAYSQTSHGCAQAHAIHAPVSNASTSRTSRDTPSSQPRPTAPRAPPVAKRPSEPPSDVGISTSLPRLGGVELRRS
eukprot:gb/GECG01004332.1/.p1 GENE.gb/GECG01004332.1/~~gb/GECG01004332.1/.p1  ORF type:complete len:682 (+),score=84.69 gb/GECG01004332.1/:1-2046(+)